MLFLRIFKQTTKNFYDFVSVQAASHHEFVIKKIYKIL